MNPNLAVDILELALGVVKQQAAGKVQQEAALADALLRIIQKSVQAYQAQTGLPLDPAQIKPEGTLA